MKFSNNLIPFILSFILLLSCHKKASIPELKSLSISEVKTWFDNNIIQVEQAMFSNPVPNSSSFSDQRILARMSKLEKLMDWSNAYFYNVGEIRTIIVPVKHNKNLKSANYDIARSVLFYQKTSGNIELNIIEILGAKAQKIKEKVTELTTLAVYNKLTGKSDAIIDIDATIFFYDYTYQSTTSFALQGNKWAVSYSRLINKHKINSSDSDNKYSIQSTSENQSCTTFYVVYDWYNEYGELVDWEILYS
jgi:hypothetical protein